ncbi:MAG: hypothetical protein Q8O67_15065 [Deltaproteobacteria bacterium]|nr:hypothetical protein [Deltaproteobacteria bacterium]
MTAPIEELRALVAYDAGQNERECGAVLEKHAATLARGLVARLSAHFVGIRAEITVTTGRTDIAVLAEEATPTGKKMKAIIWELKAPQLFLFEIENDMRARPTVDLYGAENQVLHYFWEIRQNGAFMKKYDIQSDADVVLGGVIIGRDGTLHRPQKDVDAKEAERLATQAFNARRECLYHERFSLITWSNVLQAAEHQISNTALTATTPEVLPQGAGPVVSGSV